MLSIGKLGAGQERYYLDKVAEGAEDYYSGEGEAEGQWKGEGARELGLEGAVAPDQLTAMLTGDNPASGESLGLRAVGGRGAVPGFDLTFSVPKSASLLWALGDPETSAAVNAALDRSVDAALGYLEREACLTRRGADAEMIRGSGFLAAAYRHRTSRAGDPQLHVHALIANATQGPDGKWTRLHHPTIYHHAKTAGYLFEAQFRYELTQSLGVRWQGVRNGIAEIEGFEDSHLREFSTRRREILEATGPDASARSRQVATLATRTAKEDVTLPTLRERWQDKAEEIGLTGRRLGVAIGRDATPARQLGFEQIERAVTAHASHFDRRDVVQAVAAEFEAGAPVGDVEAVADSFLARPDVLAIGSRPKGERFTTRRIWELEQRALATAEDMADQGDRALAGELVAHRVISARQGLKADQREMVRRLLASGSGVEVVIGEAGTGKTYATLAAAEGWAQAGVSVRAAAPTWRAAGVLRQEGLEATSVARLLAEMERASRLGKDALPHNSVLVIDEAGMVGSATLARLIHHAEESGAKLVLIGDPEQLGEIEAGGLFRALADRNEPTRLDEVIRHRHDADREAAKRIRAGEGREALALYRSEERLTIAPDAEARRELIVADWWQSFRRGEDALMIAKRNAEVGELNRMAREVMKEDGSLTGPEVEVGGERFAAGDQIITRINDHRNQIYNRERWRVTEVHAESGEVVLDGIDTARRVCVDSVFLKRLRDRDGGPAIEHAYAATTYQAQGSTIDRAFVVADPSMDKQELYVASSRSREETWLYATPEIQAQREEIAPTKAREGLAHIAEAAERNGAQLAAHDEALRSRLEPLSASELVARYDGLRTASRNDPRARAERAVIDHLLSRQERAAATAARLNPPTYITDTLGERPGDPAKRARWDKAVREIEGYRLRYGVRDQGSALGEAPKGAAARAARERARLRIERGQRRFSKQRSVDPTRGIEGAH
jgi:conjugative relaxase-like TrwC/TraI family protein